MEVHTAVSILSAKTAAPPKKRVHDPDSVEFLAEPHILQKAGGGSRLFGHSQDQRIPVREAVKAVHIDSRENVVDRWLGHLESGMNSTCSGRYFVEFSTSGTVTKNSGSTLQRHNAGSLPLVRQDQLHSLFFFLTGSARSSAQTRIFVSRKLRAIICVHEFRPDEL